MRWPGSTSGPEPSCSVSVLEPLIAGGIDPVKSSLIRTSDEHSIVGSGRPIRLAALAQGSLLRRPSAAELAASRAATTQGNIMVIPKFISCLESTGHEMVRVRASRCSTRPSATPGAVIDSAAMTST